MLRAVTGPHSSAGGDGRSVLVRCLLDPTSTLELTPRDWNRLLLQARTSGLIGRLEASLREHKLFLI